MYPLFLYLLKQTNSTIQNFKKERKSPTEKSKNREKPAANPMKNENLRKSCIRKSESSLRFGGGKFLSLLGHGDD